jgi:hypothetical protein
MERQVMQIEKFKVAIGAALLLAGSIASAQVAVPIRPAYAFPSTPTGTGPASVQVGSTPFFFTPYLGVAAGYDDNLFLSNANEKSSAIWVVTPGLRFDARDASKVFMFSYNTQFGRFTQSEDDDYIDHNLMTSLDVAVAPRTYARLDYGYTRNHDPRGSTDRAIQERPDRYKLSAPGITVAHGTPGGAGRVEVYYSDASKRYLNNRTTTIGSDRDTQEFGGAFYWRVMPRTYALVDVRRTDQSYKLSTSPFSSTERRVYGGISWEATAATTGTIKVGSLKKRFESDLPQYSSTAWEALITWQPRTYSRFDIYTARFPTESTGLGNFIQSDATGVVWTHSWSSIISTALNARYQKDEYQGVDRTDDVKSIGVKVGYKFRRWLTLGAEFTHTQRDSNASFFEYDKNLYLLTATASM